MGGRYGYRCEQRSGDARGGVYAAARDEGGGRVRGCSPGVGLRGVCARVRAPVARACVLGCGVGRRCEGAGGGEVSGARVGPRSRGQCAGRVHSAGVQTLGVRTRAGMRCGLAQLGAGGRRRLGRGAGRGAGHVCGHCVQGACAVRGSRGCARARFLRGAAGPQRSSLSPTTFFHFADRKSPFAPQRMQATLLIGLSARVG